MASVNQINVSADALEVTLVVGDEQATASRHDNASKTSFAERLRNATEPPGLLLAMSDSRSPERCQASADGRNLRPARMKTVRTFR